MTHNISFGQHGERTPISDSQTLHVWKIDLHGPQVNHLNDAQQFIHGAFGLLDQDLRSSLFGGSLLSSSFRSIVGSARRRPLDRGPASALSRRSTRFPARVE